MNYKELMIGNWVAYKNDFPDKHLQGMIGTVAGIPGRIDIRTTDGKFHDSEHSDWLQPIPLTRELIELNDWKCYNTYRQFSHRSVPFELRQQEDGGFIFQVAGNEYGSSPFLFIKYVHELQNLMTICGCKVAPFILQESNVVATESEGF